MPSKKVEGLESRLICLMLHSVSYSFRRCQDVGCWENVGESLESAALCNKTHRTKTSDLLSISHPMHMFSESTKPPAGTVLLLPISHHTDLQEGDLS